MSIYIGQVREQRHH